MSANCEHAVNDHTLVVLDDLELDTDRVAYCDPMDGRGPRLAEAEQISQEMSIEPRGSGGHCVVIRCSVPKRRRSFSASGVHSTR